MYSVVKRDDIFINVFIVWIVKNCNTLDDKDMCIYKAWFYKNF